MSKSRRWAGLGNFRQEPEDEAERQIAGRFPLYALKIASVQAVPIRASAASLENRFLALA